MTPTISNGNNVIRGKGTPNCYLMILSS